MTFVISTMLPLFASSVERALSRFQTVSKQSQIIAIFVGVYGFVAVYKLLWHNGGYNVDEEIDAFKPPTVMDILEKDEKLIISRINVVKEDIEALRVSFDLIQQSSDEKARELLNTKVLGIDNSITEIFTTIDGLIYLAVEEEEAILVEFRKRRKHLVKLTEEAAIMLQSI
eukprot:Tbor_TRINITY_DN4318_c0_g1::TRINITY_DN4318_c0_g1_i1::g.7675::m.7675